MKMTFAGVFRGEVCRGGIDQGCSVFKEKVIQPHQRKGRDHKDWQCWRQILAFQGDLV